MRRLGLLTAVTLCGGCASTWEVASSKRFRDDPFGVMFKESPAPLAVLTNPDATGDARARALRDLSEPGGGEARDQAMQILSDAATKDASPWVRMCAIDAAGRFRDPRAAEVIVAAYRRAPGVEASADEKQEAVAQAGVRPSARVSPEARLSALAGPQGFSADQVTAIRTHAIEALAKTGRPEAVAFLARVAKGETFSESDDMEGRDRVRRAAVAGLASLRGPESAAALAKVLSEERGRDPAMAGIAHAGLQEMTGKNLPPDSTEWDNVIQAGFEARR